MFMKDEEIILLKVLVEGDSYLVSDLLSVHPDLQSC